MNSGLRAFTLLELLVVLVILGLAAAVATPSLTRLVDSLGERDNRDQLMNWLRSVPVTVMRERSPRRLPQTTGFAPAGLVLGPDAAETLSNLDGLEVWIPRAIDYRLNGACTGGVMHWRLPGKEQITFDLPAPYCQPAPRS